MFGVQYEVFNRMGIFIKKKKDRDVAGGTTPRAPKTPSLAAEVTRYFLLPLLE